MHTECYAAKYVSPGHRTANAEEILARRVARELKIPPLQAIEIAAPKLATLINPPCWLVPVPASTGSLIANLILSRAIAAIVSGARVKCALGRSRAVESSSGRRTRGLRGLTVEEHCIVRITGPIELLPLYFVDNVITTGTTVVACRRALGWGTGLAFADASTGLARV